MWSAVVIGFGAKALKPCHRFRMGMSVKKKRRQTFSAKATKVVTAAVQMGDSSVMAFVYKLADTLSFFLKSALLA
jgi:hypothetical protein